MSASYAQLADEVASRLIGRGPHLVGIAGAVAVGKTAVAEALGAELVRRGRRAEIVSTDAFLFPNAVLGARGILYRKGFPESYDMDALVAFVHEVRSGADRIEVPVYSHATYDVVPGRVSVVKDPDVVLLEGVVALQGPLGGTIDLGVFVDAAEPDVKRWFVERFLRLTEDARSDPSSFYARFAELGPDEVRSVAAGTWDAINGPNLHEHIAPTRARAGIVVEKDANHAIRLAV